MAKIAVVYYSSTSHTYQMALAIAEGAESVGAEVRLRKVAELAPDAAIDGRAGWREHLTATAEVPEATIDDLEWADGFLFGTPTRFGLPAAQLKQFLDQCGGLWFQGKLQDKPVGVFGGAGNLHGGQEATLLALNNTFYHWGAVIVPPGYTSPLLREAGGNPYGTSFTASPEAQLPAAKLAAARFHGQRVARFAEVLAPRRAYLAAKEEA
jgi:NAD(P)H dehydrogenase (quinone)